MKLRNLLLLQFLLINIWFGGGKASAQSNMAHKALSTLSDTASGYAPISQATLLIKQRGKNKKVLLQYHDHLNNYVFLSSLENNDTVRLSFRNFLVVDFANKDAAPFIVLPNDKIEVSLDTTDRGHLEAHDPVRNAELNLFNEMVKSTQAYFGLFYHTPVLKTEGFAKRDSLLDDNLNRKLAFLEEYSASHPFRPEMEQLSKQFLIHNAQFWRFMIVINKGGTEEELKTIYYSHLAKYLQSQKRFSYYFPDFRVIAASSLNFGFIASSGIKKEPEGISPENKFLRNLALTGSFFDRSLVEPLQYMLLKNPNNQKLANYKQLLQDYATRHPGTDFTQHLRSELAYRESINNNKNFEGNQLLTQKDASLSLEEMIAKKRGKVLYVDFWASWCVPCLEEMPKSIELQKKFKGMPVEFVYLSVDKSKTAWAKGQQRYPQALQSANSFLLLNDFSAPFAKGLRLQSIPRYLLIDKSGKIVNTNAPRPSEPDLLEKELAGLLK